MKRAVLTVVLTLPLIVSSVQAADLLQIYDLALENDAQLRGARASRNAAMEAKPQARALLLPNLSLSAGANRINTDNESGSSSEYTSKTASVDLVQPLIRADYWIQLGQANQQVAKAELEFAAAEQEMITRVAQAYFDVLSAQDSLKFSKAETTAISRQLDQAKQRFDVGLIAITSVHEAQAAYDQSRADLIVAENGLNSAREALREIIKEGAPTLSTLTDDLPMNPPQPDDIEMWSSAAQQQNLAILAAMKDTAIARKNLSLQNAGHLPTLDLVGSRSLSHTDDLPTGTDSDSSSVGVQLSMPLFSGGAVLSRSREARYELEAAQEGLDAQRRAVERQVRDAYRGVLASISQVEALKASTVSAQSALEATEVGFEVGTRTMVDVLSAQRDLYRIRSSYADVRYNYIMSGLLLKQAAGTLTKEDLVQVNGWLN
jgi:outer membrane protein